MVLRSAGIDFAGGALVYPGGKSDPADLTEETAAYCDGVDGLDLVGIGSKESAAFGRLSRRQVSSLPERKAVAH